MGEIRSKQCRCLVNYENKKEMDRLGLYECIWPAVQSIWIQLISVRGLRHG
jgi:hypothetical protein